MIDFKSKLDEKADISVEIFEAFHTFLMENLFNELPDGASIELCYGYTTLSYLQVRYLIQIPNNHAVLSMIVLGNKSFRDDKKSIHTDFLKTDYSVLNRDMNKSLSGVRVFEDNFDKFRNTFYQYVIPSLESYRWKA